MAYMNLLASWILAPSKFQFAFGSLSPCFHRLALWELWLTTRLSAKKKGWKKSREFPLVFAYKNHPVGWSDFLILFRLFFVLFWACHLSICMPKVWKRARVARLQFQPSFWGFHRSTALAHLSECGLPCLVWVPCLVGLQRNELANARHTHEHPRSVTLKSKICKQTLWKNKSQVFQQVLPGAYDRAACWFFSVLDTKFGSMSQEANVEECLWISLALQLPWHGGFYRLESMHLRWNALHF